MAFAYTNNYGYAYDNIDRGEHTSIASPRVVSASDRHKSRDSAAASSEDEDDASQQAITTTPKQFMQIIYALASSFDSCSMDARLLGCLHGCFGRSESPTLPHPGLMELFVQIIFFSNSLLIIRVERHDQDTIKGYGIPWAAAQIGHPSSDPSGSHRPIFD